LSKFEVKITLKKNSAFFVFLLFLNIYKNIKNNLWLKVILNYIFNLLSRLTFFIKTLKILTFQLPIISLKLILNTEKSLNSERFWLPKLRPPFGGVQYSKVIYFSNS
jgi:hypothetical protein